MQSKLVLLASATGALAAVRDLSGSLPQNYARALAARQDDGTPECLSVVASNTAITADFPLPPAQLATATDLGAVPTVTDPCDFPTVTGSLGPVITSYSAALQSWQDKHITALRSVYSACSDVPAFSELVGQFGDAICSTALAPFTSALPTAVSTATATVTESASGTEASAETEASSTATVTVATSATETGAEETTAAASTDAAGDAEATTNTSFNAAPRETGMVMAAAAAAGIVGAVML
ncbi:hypothetical protein CPLU01_13030 [Colletotrichum plurivorum]|uniref:Infection structure specific protein n=1 Tax=Colletotrichum plurivorum TaxID=2175906 RepID=A0A8H6N4N0_9PEZI|nr:hypothetical protein CPLU01_13030 [Colletotrichum plurivorum]